MDQGGGSDHACNIKLWNYSDNPIIVVTEEEKTCAFTNKV